MKSNYMNYFKGGKLYQWDKDMNVYSIEPTNIAGEFCLDKKGMDILLKFKSPNITKGKTLKVQEGKTVVHIPLTEQALVFPRLEFNQTFRVDAAALQVAQEFTATDNKRPQLMGVYIGESISATDNMTVFTCPAFGTGNVIIAKEFISALPKTGTLELKANNNMVAYENEERIVIGKLLDGKYPDTTKLALFQGNQKEIDLTPIKECLRFYTDMNDKVVLRKNSVSLEGAFNTTVEADFPIDFNCKTSAKFLDKVLKHIEYDTCWCEARGKFLVFNGNFVTLCLNE